MDHYDIFPKRVSNVNIILGSTYNNITTSRKEISCLSNSEYVVPRWICDADCFSQSVVDGFFIPKWTEGALYILENDESIPEWVREIDSFCGDESITPQWIKSVEYYSVSENKEIPPWINDRYFISNIYDTEEKKNNQQKGDLNPCHYYSIVKK